MATDMQPGVDGWGDATLYQDGAWTVDGRHTTGDLDTGIWFRLTGHLTTDPFGPAETRRTRFTAALETAGLRVDPETWDNPGIAYSGIDATVQVDVVTVRLPGTRVQVTGSDWPELAGSVGLVLDSPPATYTTEELGETLRAGRTVFIDLGGSVCAFHPNDLTVTDQNTPIGLHTPAAPLPG